MIKETLLKFHDDFFEGNKLDSEWYKTCLQADLKIKRSMKIKPSFGKGNKAFVPWIVVYDQHAVATIQKGYYLVYLFTADGSGIYLSLQQGITKFKEMISHIKTMGYEKNWLDSINNINEYWRGTQILSDDDTNLKDIDLKLIPGKANTTPLGYVAANIYSRFYSIDDLANGKISNETLLSDFKTYMQSYEKLLEVIGFTTHEKWNENFCLHVSQYIEYPTIQIEKESKGIYETDPPEKRYNGNKIRRSTRLSNGPTDWDAIQKYKSVIGARGELAYLKYIEESRKELDKDFHDEMIRHVSQQDGDSAGYDILEIDSDGNECYIEVKTTSKGIHTPFFLSSNELEFSKKHSEHYKLIRIYNYVNEHCFQYYPIEGNMEAKLDLEPTNYICELKEKMDT